jgi:hypothetical protein
MSRNAKVIRSGFGSVGSVAGPAATVDTEAGDPVDPVACPVPPVDGASGFVQEDPDRPTYYLEPTDRSTDQPTRSRLLLRSWG